MSVVRSGRPPRAPVLASASGPTPEFRLHHDVLAPTIDRKVRREAWVVSSRFARLNPDEATQAAADRFYRDAAIASGAREPRATVRVDDGGRTDGISDSQVIAQANLRDAKNSLGEFAYALVYWCIVEDRSWTDTAHQYRWDRETARENTRLCIQALVEYYALRDNARKFGRRVEINTAEPCSAETASLASESLACRFE